jgi:hypothetical protein
MPANTRALLEKIKALPDHRSCSRRCVNSTKSSTSAIRALTRAVTATSRPSFAAVWSNSEDDCIQADACRFSRRTVDLTEIGSSKSLGEVAACRRK